MNSNNNVCPTCEKRFTFKQNLVRHMKIHSGIKPFVCKICSKAFLRNTSLKLHAKIHEGTFMCDVCKSNFNSNLDLMRHTKIHTVEEKFRCNVCLKSFGKKSYLMKHSKIHEGNFKCNECETDFNSKMELKQHKKEHIEKKQASIGSTFKKTWPKITRVGDLFKTDHLTANNSENNYDLRMFFKDITSDLSVKLEEYLTSLRSIKWYSVLTISLSRIGNDTDESDEEDTDYIQSYFRSNTQSLLVSEDIPSQINDAFSKIETSFEEFVQNGSNWRMENILHLEINAVQYAPF